MQDFDGCVSDPMMQEPGSILAVLSWTEGFPSPILIRRGSRIIKHVKACFLVSYVICICLLVN